MKSKQLILIVLFAIISLSCQQKSTNTETETKHQNTSENEHQENHWSYVGETGPEHWDEIEKDSDCDGLYQSPINIIDIDAVKQKSLGKLEINYASQTKIHDVINNGHSIQYNFEKGDYILFNHKKFDLKQIHFHESAEHTINGIRYPMEIHMVHQNDQNQIAVFAIMVEEGESSEPFEFLEKYLPTEQGETKIIDASFDLNLNFPKNKNYYYYVGSLTTPPCSEGVLWFVFKQSISISLEQVIALQKIMPIHNYRNERPLNGRIVVQSDY